MPRISALPSATSAQTTDELPIVQGAVTKRLTFATAQTSGLFLPADNTISTNKLIDDAVTADKLQSDISVNANRAVTPNHIQDSAIITDKISNLNVTTPKLADGAVTNIKLGADSLSISKFNTADRNAIANASSARVGGRVLTDGFVRNIVVYVGGSGYVPATPPAVTVSAPATAGGLTATATAIVSGTAVTSIVVTSSGSGYLSDPVVTIAAPASGTTAKAVGYALVNGLANTTDSMSRSSGIQHGSIIMTTDLKLKSFGYNGYGQLGIAQDNGVVSLPQEVLLYTNSNTPPLPVKWYTSGGSCYIIDEFGGVWSAGYNGYGQLGHNGTSNSFVFQNIPQTYFSNKPIVKIATQAASSTEAKSVMALAADGTVYAWGYKGYGQLGLGNTSQQNTPVIVPGTGTTYIISDVAIGANVSASASICAMIASNVNNQVLVAGYNGHGALADGTVNDRSTLAYWNSASGVPIQNAKNIHICGDYPSIAVSTTIGELWTAGYNGHGQLGKGNTANTGAGYATRVIVSGVNDVTGVGGHYGNFATRMNDGTIRVWGYNGYGQLGNGVNTTDGLTPTNTFTQYAGRTVVKIFCSAWNYQTTALLLSDGSIYCAGYDGYSRQGRQDGQSLSSRVAWDKFKLPRTDIVDLKWQGYNSYSHLEVLTSDGKIYSAGYNGNGDLCRGDYTNRYGISNYLL